MQNDFHTLTGLDLPALITRLDAELPPEAYNPVPGAADLTDICPNWMRKTFNEVFGLCGLGWGYTYQSADIQVLATGEAGARAREATLTRLELWFVLLGPDGSLQRCVIPASGGSENRNAAYALKGAITSAISNAASNIGFQESVYLGRRSHRTVKRAVASAPGMPLPKPAPPARNGHGPVTAQQTAPVVLAELVEPDLVDPGDFIIPLGRNQGRKLREVPEAWIRWAAQELQPSGEQVGLLLHLQEAARAYLSGLDQG